MDLFIPALWAMVLAVWLGYQLCERKWVRRIKEHQQEVERRKEEFAQQLERDLCNVADNPLSMIMLAMSGFSEVSGEHTHQCEECGELWTHGSEAKFEQNSHNCPKCGHLQLEILMK